MTSVSIGALLCGSSFSVIVSWKFCGGATLSLYLVSIIKPNQHYAIWRFNFFITRSTAPILLSFIIFIYLWRVVFPRISLIIHIFIFFIINTVKIFNNFLN